MRYTEKGESSDRQPAVASLTRLRARLAHSEGGWLFASIAHSVIERRVELEMSQSDLARLCGTTQSAIARLESGGRPPRIDTLLRLADALDCDLHVELRPRPTEHLQVGEST